jgi:hypothetical protein
LSSEAPALVDQPLRRTEAAFAREVRFDQLDRVARDAMPGQFVEEAIHALLVVGGAGRAGDHGQFAVARLKQRSRRQLAAVIMVGAERGQLQFRAAAVQERHLRVHLLQHDQVFVVQVVTQHDDAVAIAADQELDRFNRLVARRAVAAAGGHDHVAAHGAQLDVGLLEDGAVVRAEEGRRKNADHAQ